MRFRFAQLFLVSTATTLVLTACGSDSGNPLDEDVPQSVAPVSEDTVIQPSVVSDASLDDSQQLLPTDDTNEGSEILPSDSIVDAQQPTTASNSIDDNLAGQLTDSNNAGDQQTEPSVAGTNDDTQDSLTDSIDAEVQQPTAPIIDANDGQQSPSENLNPVSSESVVINAPITATSQMAFLERLGPPPYADLPVIDAVPWSRTISFLPEDAQAQFSDDCLLDNFGSTFCYSPGTRLLQAVLNDGQPFWSFNLPGDSATNRIDGINMTRGDQLTILANITTEFGDPRHELSFFTQTGEFLQTLDIFGLDGSRWPAINIQGEPLIVDKILDRDSFGQRFDLRVIGNHYEFAPGGNRAIPSDWTQVGTVTANLDGDTGQYIDITLCEGAQISVPSLWPGGPPPCDDVSEFGELSRNTAQRQLHDDVISVASDEIRFAAEHVIRAGDTAAGFGLTTDLPCYGDRLDAQCAMLLLPGIGDMHLSSTTTIECSEPAFDNETLLFITGTAQLNQTLVRTSEGGVELRDQFSFTNRCGFGNGQFIIGNATVVSNISLNTGSVTDSETLFDDLTSIVGFGALRFIDGNYRANTPERDGISYNLQSSRIDRGGICSRSCAPLLGFGGFFSNVDIDVSKFADGGYDYNLSADWTATAGNPEQTPLLGVADTIVAELSFSGAVNDTGRENPLTGFAEVQGRNGATVRMMPTSDLNFPDIPFVEYELTQIDGSMESWKLPLLSFLDLSIKSLRLP